MVENFKVKSVDDQGRVSLQTDRPGERATSVTVEAREAIQAIADAAGLTVTIEDQQAG